MANGVSASDFEVVASPKPTVYAPESVDLTPHINAAATRFNLDPTLLQSLVKVESGGNVRAVSPAGALGAFQIMPQTAKLLGYKPDEMYDPSKAAMAAGQYLSDSRDRFSQYTKDPNELNDMVIASYNAGPNAVENAVKRGGARWRMLVPRDRIAPTGKTYLEKVRGAVSPAPAEASDFEVVSGGDFETVPPPVPDVLNPNKESLFRGALSELTNPEGIHEGPLGILRNIQRAGGRVGRAGVEAYARAMEGGGPISRMWESALPSGPEGETGRVLRESTTRAAGPVGEQIGEAVADPLLYGPVGVGKVFPRIERALTEGQGIARTIRRGGVRVGPSAERPVPAPPAPEPVVKRPFAPEPPIITAPAPEVAPVASDFEVTASAAERVPPTAELPSAADVRPALGPERPLVFDAQGRPVRAERRPVEAPVAPPAELPSGPLESASTVAEQRTGGVIPPKPPVQIRSASELAQTKTGGLVEPNPEGPAIIKPPAVEPEPPTVNMTERAEGRIPPPDLNMPQAAEVRPELGPERPRLFDPQGRPVKAETPTERLIRKGGSISGGRAVAEDVGWVNPAGEELSHSGKTMSGSHGQEFEMTHSEAVQNLHGQKDIGQALADGWVRYAVAGNHLNVETGLKGIDNAIKFISRNGRTARGGVIIELTDLDGGMLESQIFDRPYQAIEYLKSKQTTEGITASQQFSKEAYDFVAKQGGLPTRDNLNYAVAYLKNHPPRPIPETPTARVLRRGKGISGGSDAELPSKYGPIDAGVKDFVEELRAKGYPTTHSGSGLAEEASHGQATRPYVAFDYSKMGSNQLSDLEQLMKAKGWTEDTQFFGNGSERAWRGPAPKGARKMRPISGGSDAPIGEQPLMSARERAMRRSEPKSEPAPEAPKPEKAPEPTAPPAEAEVAGPRKPAGKRSLREALSDMLPKERAVLRENPNSPVISAVERHQAYTADELSKLSQEPWFKKVMELDPEQLKSMEAEAVRVYKDGGSTPEALEAAIKDWPDELKQYVRHRNAALAEENASRARIAMEPVREEFGPYIPRISDADAKEAFRVSRNFGGGGLQTSLRGAEKERSFATAREGETRGITYEDPRNAILLREYNGIQVRATERLITELKAEGALFETEAAARAASPKGEAFLVQGIPGNEVLYAPTRAEAQFLVQNLKAQPTGIQLPGKLGNAKAYVDQWLRNPNLINPAPHAVKNMGFKYLISRGPVGMTKLPRDMVEFFKGSNPKLLEEFRKFMPYSEADPAFMQLQQQLHKAGAAKAYQIVSDLVRKVNQGSSNVIFKWADPSMRYSLFKHYINKGMAPQEAANNAWIDLVRYGTRSDLVDFWKSIPSNFFVPWRVGTWTSVLKNMAKYPFRTLLLLGSIDLAREIRYRETGRWSHWPHDYIEGPIMLVLEDAAKGQPGRTGWQAMINAALGPGGEATASQIARMFSEPNADTNTMKSIFKSLWGIGQLLPTGDMMTELMKFKEDGNPSHIANAVGALIFAERQVYKTVNGRRTGFEPHRALSVVPESALPKDYSVKYNELVTGKQHK